MAVKPYSFRYLYEIQRVLSPWRSYFQDQKVATGAGSQDYEQVVQFLDDRDRQIEDYLTLGIGQGILAAVVNTTQDTPLTSSTVDINGMSLTVIVPANRVLRAFASLPLDNNGGTDPEAARIQIWEGVTQIAATTLGNLRPVAQADRNRAIFVHYIQPTPGEHTYRLRGNTLGLGLIDVDVSATEQGIFSIEDVGPVGTVTVI